MTKSKGPGSFFSGLAIPNKQQHWLVISITVQTGIVLYYIFCSFCTGSGSSFYCTPPSFRFTNYQYHPYCHSRPITSTGMTETFIIAQPQAIIYNFPVRNYDEWHTLRPFSNLAPLPTRPLYQLSPLDRGLPTRPPWVCQLAFLGPFRR